MSSLQGQEDAHHSTSRRPGSAQSNELYALYLDERVSRDKALEKSWSEKANGIVIFAALFSAIIATFVVDSYKSLQPDSEDITVLALSRISQQLAASANGSSRPDAFSSDTSTLQAPLAAVRVNALWFVSLVLSISAAIGAVVVQQCTLDYLTRQSEQQHNNQRDVRTQALWHAYFLQGVERSFLINVLDYLGAVLHLAYFLFLAGLLVLLSDINETVFNATLVVVVLISVLYAAMSFIPAVYPPFPYRTPLTPPLSILCLIIKRVVLPPAAFGLVWSVSVAFFITYFALGFVSGIISGIIFAFSWLLYTVLRFIFRFDIPSPVHVASRILDVLSRWFDSAFSSDSWLTSYRHHAERYFLDLLSRTFIGDLSDYLTDNFVVLKTKDMVLGSDSNVVTFLSVSARRIASHTSHPHIFINAITSSASTLRNVSSRLFDSNSLISDDSVMQARMRMAHDYLHSVWLLQAHALDTRDEQQSNCDFGSLYISLIPPAIKHAALSTSGHVLGPGVTVMARCTVALATHSMFMKLRDPSSQETHQGIFRQIKECYAMSLFTRAHRADWDWIVSQSISVLGLLLDDRDPSLPSAHDAAPIQYLSAFVYSTLPYLDTVEDAELGCIMSTARYIVSDIQSALCDIVAPVADPATRLTFHRLLEDLRSSQITNSGDEAVLSDVTTSSAPPAAEAHWSQLLKAVRRRHLLAELMPVQDLLDSISFDEDRSRRWGYVNPRDTFFRRMAKTGLFGEDGTEAEDKSLSSAGSEAGGGA